MSQRRITNHSASIRQRLLDRARRTGESYEDLLIRYGIERFLYRLGVSPHKDRFVLKGAILFQVWDRESARMTRDIDLLGYGDMSVDAVQRILRGTLSGQFDNEDGLLFDPESSRSVGLAKDTPYSGVRAIVQGELAPERLLRRVAALSAVLVRRLGVAPRRARDVRKAAHARSIGHTTCTDSGVHLTRRPTTRMDNIRQASEVTRRRAASYRGSCSADSVIRHTVVRAAFPGIVARRRPVDREVKAGRRDAEREPQSTSQTVV